jgi:hypothetical protein
MVSSFCGTIGFSVPSVQVRAFDCSSPNTITLFHNNILTRTCLGKRIEERGRRGGGGWGKGNDAQGKLKIIVFLF